MFINFDQTEKLQKFPPILIDFPFVFEASCYPCLLRSKPEKVTGWVRLLTSTHVIEGLFVTLTKTKAVDMLTNVPEKNESIVMEIHHASPVQPGMAKSMPLFNRLHVHPRDILVRQHSMCTIPIPFFFFPLLQIVRGIDEPRALNATVEHVLTDEQFIAYLGLRVPKNLVETLALCSKLARRRFRLTSFFLNLY